MTDGRTDDGQNGIAIAHLVNKGELKKINKSKKKTKKNLWGIDISAFIFKYL